MASKSDRQRKLERARVERRLARQAHRARRKRQIQAGIGGSLALILIVLGVTWALGGFSSKPAEPAAEGACLWVPANPTGTADPTAAADTGTPPAGELHSGFETMTIKTNLGDIEAMLDLSKAPCAAASFKYLGDKAFFNSSNCHMLNTTMKTLDCGRKSDGTVGPSYQFADEDIPTAPLTPAASASASASPSASGAASPSASASASAAPTSGPVYYAKGTIVMVNSGANTNGSAFKIIYDDNSPLSAAYSIVGTITKGLEVVQQVAAAGALDADGKVTVEGKPKTTLTIQQLSVATPTAPSSDAVPPSGEPNPTPSTAGSAAA